MNWTSVNDQLPPFGQRVFTLFYPENPTMEGLLPGVDYRRDISGTSIELTQRLAEKIRANNGFNSNVVFWMDVPKKPQPESNQ